jgi:hypothetical protein
MMGEQRDRISRHNNIVKELYRTCQSALFNQRLEERNLMHGNERPGDLFVENWAHGRLAAFDVSVIHPAAYSYFRNASKRFIIVIVVVLHQNLVYSSAFQFSCAGAVSHESEGE